MDGGEPVWDFDSDPSENTQHSTFEQAQAYADHLNESRALSYAMTTDEYVEACKAGRIDYGYFVAT